jgi:tetratricopeptide (TPR) repeat protein
MANPEEKTPKIYCKEEKITVGFGCTQKVVVIKNYYQMIDKDEDHIECQLLNSFDEPMGFNVVIEREKLKEYTYCPDYFENKKTGKEIMMEHHIEKGDKHFAEKEYYSAEHEYDRALALDDDNLRANLGKGNTLFARGERKKGEKVFAKLSNIEALYDQENKHIFNEFGIELRRKGMLNEAITNYGKAINIDPDDWVLYYNLAKAYYEKGDLIEATNQLKTALTINPGFREAKDFLESIEETLVMASQQSQ